VVSGAYLANDLVWAADGAAPVNPELAGVLAAIAALDTVISDLFGGGPSLPILPPRDCKRSHAPECGFIGASAMCVDESRIQYPMGVIQAKYTVRLPNIPKNPGDCPRSRSGMGAKRTTGELVESK
jgi:hypothetical protein